MKKTSNVPWASLAISPKKALVIDADGMTVAKLDGENAVSDSYLIETAPEMLEALVQAKAEIIELLAGESCDHSVGICYCQTNNRLSMIEEAIKKAQP